MPYILVLLPLTAVLFGAIPYAADISLGFLLAVLLLLNMTKQSVRGPVVALMPDTIPADYRSEANGVINTMGGIASIVGTIGLARLSFKNQKCTEFRDLKFKSALAAW